MTKKIRSQYNFRSSDPASGIFRWMTSCQPNWRILNLLYYVTPERKEENGGHLEIWPNGLKNEQIILHRRFNRLRTMVRKVFKKGIRKNPHHYKKDQ
ncbi:MAG: hypothetical protein KJO23_00855 [Bacteroidia bacterium]|nr:hypothetical protein [Bacteroidia bacterium]